MALIAIEFRDADGDQQMARLTPADALALLQVLAARLQEWTDEPESGNDADEE